MKNGLFLAFVSLLVSACSINPPENFKFSSEAIQTTPDYSGVVIPWNIAPMNFLIENQGDEYLAVARSTKGPVLKVRGNKVQWHLEEWQQLLEANKGDTLYLELYLRREEQWLRLPLIKSYIAPEPIDPFLSYRLIEPAYELYEQMTINQRRLTNFDEEILYNNSSLSRNEEGQCINCHAYQDYNRNQQMQFHIRHRKGGTVIADDSGIQKVDLNTDSIISAGVYPAWHPQKNFIAYSVNNTEQHFLKKGSQKVEVMDARSDLVLYDVEKNELRHIANDPEKLETFPAWSPDGKYLYYASASYPEGVGPEDHLIKTYNDFRYNLYRKAFDSETLEFADAELVFDAAAIKKSATLPRISPDGNYLLFTLADYGNFHIWHKSADLYLIDLKNGALRPMTEINSPDVDSYHSWSSGGAWIVFSSRREDGSYTRPYFSYFMDGKAHKPFILPQEDPEFHATLFKSFNIPEFMVEPVTLPRRTFRQAIRQEPVKAVFVSRTKGSNSAGEGN